jgi:hypothetical protein
MAKKLGPADPFKLIIDRRALNDLLMSETSDVALDLAFRAQRIAASARRRAPRKTGALKASIGWSIGADEEGLYADIGSDLLYGKFVETGHVTSSGSRVAPRRYLRPALRAGRGKR